MSMIARLLSTGGVVQPATDPYFSNVVLLLHMDGSNGGTTFTDSSSYGRTVTPTTTTTSNTQIKFGSAAGYFSAASSNLNVTLPALGTGDFTVETWIYLASLTGANQRIIITPNGGAVGGFALYVNSGAGISCYVGTGSVATSTTVSATTWTHIAATVTGGVLKVFINGVSSGGTATTSTVTDTSYYLGYTSLAAVGYQDDARITTVSRYTNNFTVPSAAFPDTSALPKVYNYWNPSDSNASVTLTNNNLTLSCAASNQTSRAYIGKLGGAWYWEITAGTGGTMPGVGDVIASLVNYPGYDADGWGYLGATGVIYNNNVNKSSSATYVAGNILGFALDRNAGTLKFYKNNALQYTATLGLTGLVYPMDGSGGGSIVNDVANFGASAFTYSPPAGYNAGLYTQQFQTYATWNPSDKNAQASLSGGNLVIASNALAWGGARATLGKSSGKWYWEETITVTSATNIALGISNGSWTFSSSLGADANGWGYFTDGRKVTNNTYVAYGSSYTTGTVLGFMLDLDNGTLSFLNNNAFQGIAYTGLSGTLYPTASLFSTTPQVTANFGQNPLTYTPPNGTFWNPKDANASYTFINNNLTASSSVVGMCRANTSKSTGKLYFEVTYNTVNTGSIGIANSSASLSGAVGGDINGYGLDYGGTKLNNGGSTAYGLSQAANDVVGVAVNLTDGKIYWSKNGTWMNSGTPGGAETGYAFSGISGAFFPAVGSGGAASSIRTLNTGATPFAYTPPTGYSAWDSTVYNAGVF